MNLNAFIEIIIYVLMLRVKLVYPGFLDFRAVFNILNPILGLICTDSGNYYFKIINVSNTRTKCKIIPTYIRV